MTNRLLAVDFGRLYFHRANARGRKERCSFEHALRNLRMTNRLLAVVFGRLCFHRANARGRKECSSFEHALRNLRNEI